ncbi:MAG TPA: hypothetical protein VFT31_10135 [Kribbella sp.]|nr:hypothetical protein [Kribbella sp.]
MFDTSLWRRAGRLRMPEPVRRRSSRVSRLAAQYDAQVDEALKRLWPRARVYHDREFAPDRADYLLVVRGRGVMIETKVKSDPGVFRGSTLPPLLERLQRDGRRLVVLLNQGDPTPARELVAAMLGDRARVVVWQGPDDDARLRTAVEELLQVGSKRG